MAPSSAITLQRRSSRRGRAPLPSTPLPDTTGPAQPDLVPDGRSAACDRMLVDVRRTSPRPLVIVRGELDVSGASLLTAVLEHVQERGDEGVDVDLSGVTFADTHGLAPVLDGPAVVVAASPAVRWVLDLLGALEAPAPAAPAPPTTCGG